jgi:S1-C subfamily serine protease
MNPSMMLVLALGLGAPALKDKEQLGTGPGYLGVTFTPDSEGLMITEVKPDSPASKGGLNANDIITKINDKLMKNEDTSALVNLIGGMRPGTVVTVDVLRGNEKLTLKVKLGPRPKDFETMQRPIPPIIIDPPN